MRVEPHEITQRFRLIRKNHGKKFEIKDQHGKKYMEGKHPGLRSKWRAWRLSRKVEVKDHTVFSLRDANKQPIGEICISLGKTASRLKIKDSLGEVVATLSGWPEWIPPFWKYPVAIPTKDYFTHHLPSMDMSWYFNVKLETSSHIFTVKRIEEEYEARNWRLKKIKKTHIIRVDVLDIDEKHYFSVNPISEELFGITQFEESFNLNPFIICAASFLLANMSWSPPKERFD